MCAHLCPASSTRALTQRPGSQGGDMNEAFIQKWEPPLFSEGRADMEIGSGLGRGGVNGAPISLVGPAHNPF